MTDAPAMAAGRSARIDYGKTRKDQRQLRRQWVPDGPPRAVVLIVHGISEHSGRYQRVGAQLSEAGFGVVAYDQRGHGQTEGPSGHIERFTEFLDDVEDHLDEVRSVGVPVILLGHSMGGLVATAYAISDRPAPDLLILSGPALGTDTPNWQQVAGQKLAQLSPKFFVKPPGFDTGVLSRDPKVGEAYVDDPLVKPGGSAQLLSQMLDSMQSTASQINELTVPTLCVHGEADELVPAWASEILAPLPNVTRTVYPNLRHEVFNEPEGPQVISDIVAWIDAQLGRP